MRGRAASFIYFPATLQALYCFITTHFLKAWIERKKKSPHTQSQQQDSLQGLGNGLRIGHASFLAGVKFPGASPLLQGLSSSTHSLFTCGDLNLGAGREEYGDKFLALTLWLGLCRAQSRDQMQKKAKLPMLDFPPTFTGPALLYHTGKNSHRHTSVTSHRVCTWINAEHVFTGPDSSS